jgi:hypothetical protein
MPRQNPGRGHRSHKWPFCNDLPTRAIAAKRRGRPRPGRGDPISGRSLRGPNGSAARCYPVGPAIRTSRVRSLPAIHHMCGLRRPRAARARTSPSTSRTRVLSEFAPARPRRLVGGVASRYALAAPARDHGVARGDRHRRHPDERAAGHGERLIFLPPSAVPSGPCRSCRCAPGSGGSGSSGGRGKAACLARTLPSKVLDTRSLDH